MLGYHARFTGCYQRNTYANSTYLLAATCAVTLLLAGCGDSQIQSSDNPVVNDAPVAESEYERLNAYLAEVFADNLARQPFTASYLGIKDRQDEWNPQSEAFQDEERARMEADWLSSTGSIAQRYLRGQLSLTSIVCRLSGRSCSMTSGHHAYALHQFRGAHTSIPAHHQHSPGDFSRRC